MTTPTGALVATSTQVKNRANKNFAIWIVLTLAGAGLTLVLWPSKGSAPFLLIFVLVPGIGLAIAARNAFFRSLKKLEIYPDGFILQDTKDGTTLDSALWTEVSDITWSPDKRKAAAMGAGAAFGLIGMAIASILADSSTGDSQRDLYIHVPEKKKKIPIDLSFSDPQRPDQSLGVVTREVWAAEMAKALGSGQQVEFGKIQVTPTGVRQGANTVEWKAIIEAKYLDEEGQIGVVWNDRPQSNPKTMAVRLGYKGSVLVDFVNQKVGKKPTGMSSKLGKL